MEKADTTYVKAYTLANRFEADVVADALEREDIPFWIRTFEDTAYDGLFVTQKGWGDVMVPGQYFHKALRIIYSLVKDSPTRGLYEYPEEVDPILWDTLEKLDPDDVCKRALATYREKEYDYILPFLSGSLRIVPSERLIVQERKLPFDSVDFETALIALNYLINASPTELSRKWVGEKDLPGGFVFFQGPHQLPTRPLADMYQLYPQDVIRAVDVLGGRQIQMDHGNLTFVVNVFPRVPVMLIFWKGDEEFEPQMAFRFDATITLHLPVLDQVFAMTYVLYRHIKAALEQEE